MILYNVVKNDSQFTIVALKSTLVKITLIEISNSRPSLKKYDNILITFGPIKLSPVKSPVSEYIVIYTVLEFDTLFFIIFFFTRNCGHRSFIKSTFEKFYFLEQCMKNLPQPFVIVFIYVCVQIKYILVLDGMKYSSLFFAILATVKPCLNNKYMFRATC